jgi:hypothetical protein
MRGQKFGHRDIKEEGPVKTEAETGVTLNNDGQKDPLPALVGGMALPTPGF